MSDFLPVVPKAQPLMVAWESRTFVQNPSEQELSWGKDGTVSIVSNYLAVERERAGYEKREQTLKNKIKELSIRLTSTTINAVKESNMPDAMTCGKLYKIADELLGLSKQ